MTNLNEIKKALKSVGFVLSVTSFKLNEDESKFTITIPGDQRDNLEYISQSLDFANVVKTDPRITDLGDLSDDFDIKTESISATDVQTVITGAYMSNEAYRKLIDSAVDDDGDGIADLPPLKPGSKTNTKTSKKK